MWGQGVGEPSQEGEGSHNRRHYRLHSYVNQRILTSLSWYNPVRYLLIVFTNLGQDRYIADGVRED